MHPVTSQVTYDAVYAVCLSDASDRQQRQEYHMSSIRQRLHTLNCVHHLVGGIKHLNEATAVAALGHLLSIPQHTTWTMHISCVVHAGNIPADASPEPDM